MLWLACLKGTVGAVCPGSLSLASSYFWGEKSGFLTVFTAAERQASPWDCSEGDFSLLPKGPPPKKSSIQLNFQLVLSLSNTSVTGAQEKNASYWC